MTDAMHVCVCVCVCVCVRYHTAPLYSNVRSAAMFGCPPHAAFPPSQNMCVCVCVCDAPDKFKGLSNCKSLPKN